jgi:hypothetical protein
MAYTNGLDDPTLYFNTKLYTGNSTGSTEQAITGLNFAPDLLWVKQRSGAEWHVLSDAVRGVPKNLYSNSTDAEDTIGYLTSLDTNGFTLSSSTGLNGNGSTYVSWNWKANGAGISNTDGSITSTVSANTTSGFSIVSYTGTGSNATVGHSLGVAPSMYIVKNRDDNDSWGVYHKSLGATQFLRLQGTDASATSSVWWNDTEPTSSVFSVGTAVATNASGENLIAYCFAEKKGFSKFGSYTGNGNADGTFVYTGFKPAFLIVKRYDSTNNWYMYNNKVNPFNETDRPLKADTSEDEATIFGGNELDFLSNGFKLRDTINGANGSGASYIYMAFAENPFVTSTSIPCTAR